MNYGTLRVTTPDGQVREYPIDVASVFVGRAEGNRVVVDHVSVSRRHARLVFDGGRVTVEDLGSANGTFVGSQRIAPSTPTAIEQGQALRFGDAEAVFVPEAAQRPAAAAPAGGGAAFPGVVDPQQTIAVAVISPVAPVAAGSPTTATIHIQNRGPVADALTISVPDLPATWVRVSRPALTLVPGAKDEVTVVIEPPRNSEALAGEYPFSAAVVSREHGVEIRALGSVTILPFEDVRFELKPPRSKRDFRLETANWGNTPVAYSLAALDDQSALRCQFSAESLELDPGEQRLVPLTVRTKSIRFFGPNEARPFRVEGRPAFAGQRALAAEGQLLIRPLWRILKWPVIALLIVGSVAGSVWGYRQVCGGSWPLCPGDEAAVPSDGRPTPTPKPAATPTTSATRAASATAPPTQVTGIRPGGKAVVINSAANPPTNDNCLALRSKPVIDAANLLRRLCDGAEVSVLDGPTNDGTRLWWYVNDGKGEGWAAEGLVSGAVKWLTPK